jgi:nitrogen fixation/metabolism regulation signal transduction histidine kinase
MRLENNFIFKHACMTPLTILSCTLESLQSETNQKTKEKNIHGAQNAIDYLSKLINLVTQSEQKDNAFCVNESINEVAYLFKNKNKCDLFYSNFLPIKLKLHGNKLYFQEIIICLLNNAYEAYTDKKLAHISLSVRIIKGQIFIGVVDFAKGMTPIGTKLALVKGISYKKNGLGLGLSFVKSSVETEFNGEFKIISGYGVGTHAQLSIPIPKPYNQSLLPS